MFLADISLKRPVFATVIIVALIVLGAVSYTGLPLNDMPEVEIPYVSTTIVFPGASPEQIESKVTKKVEEELSQVSGVKHTISIVNEGVSMTVLEFSMDKSPDAALEDVRTKLGSIRGELPQDIQEPVVSKIDIMAMPIMSLAVSGDMDKGQLAKLANDVVSKKLNAVKGVGSVTVFGDQEREIQIKLDKDKIAAYGLTVSEIVNSMKTDNLDVPSGKLANNDHEITLRTNSSIQKVEDFEDVLVAKRAGTEIRVRDIAEVVDGVKAAESMASYSGKPAIGIDIVKQSGANTVEVAEGVQKAVALMQEKLPAGVSLEIVRDNSVSIRSTVDDVVKTLIEGCVLAVLIVFVFLGEFGSTAISAITLPTSIISTFALMKLMDFSLNNMSLMGLSLAVGLLVDDAIVVIENIHRHLKMGKSPMQAAKDGTSEIGLAVMATTFTVCAVFVPMAMIDGIIGQFFRQFGLTVAFSVLVSMFVSFTLVPLLSSKYVKHQEDARLGVVGRALKGFNRMFDQVAKKYSSMLRSVLDHRVKTMVVVFAVFVGSLGLLPLLGSNFMPSTDIGEINITADLDSGLTLEAAGKSAKTIEEIVLKYPEVQYTYSTVKPNSISLFVKLNEKQERDKGIKEICQEMRQELKEIPGIQVVLTPSSGSIGSGKDVQYRIKGDNFEQLQNYALKAEKIMSQTPGAVDVALNYKAGKPETKIEVDRDKAADLGVSTAAVSDTTRTMFNGLVVSQFESGQDRYDVRLALKEEQREDFDSLDQVYVPSSEAGKNGVKLIPLDQLTTTVFGTSAATVNRYDKAREIQVSANVLGATAGEFGEDFMNNLQKQAPIPEGISIVTGGNQSTMEEGMVGMVVALLMGVLFIFLILAAQFESYIEPFAILFALPLGIIGAILGLVLTGSSITIFAMIGIIMLMGLVTKNGILLIDFIKQQRESGVGRTQAIIEAGRVRLQPIIMTTLAMIFGMLPTAFGTGYGSEARAPMAYTIIGGLITSTLLTLVVVPIIYTFLDDLRVRFSKKKNVGVGVGVR